MKFVCLRFQSLSIFWILTLILSLGACQSKTKVQRGAADDNRPNGGIVKPQDPPLKVPGANKITLIARPLTSLGQNSEPSFSLDGTRLLFVSRERAAHRQAQVYELDLLKMSERRVTFQDGDVSGPSYFPSGDRILYASSTDEIKEEPYVLKRLKETYLAPEPRASNEEVAELYEQTLDGNELTRLTDRPGLDKDPALGKNMLVYSAKEGEQTHLYLIKGKQAPHRLSNEPAHDESGHFSIDGLALTWSRRSEDSQTARIMLTDGDFRTPRALTSSGFLDLQPTWHPNHEEIVFSSNRGSQTKDVFNLYSIDRKGQCLKRLTHVEGLLLHPVFHPDGKQVAFTLVRQGQSQVYIMDYLPPSECLTP